MLDKIRLHAAGRLPAEYQANLGSGFDRRCCGFLQVPYPELVARVQRGGTDEEILAWCDARAPRTDDECNIWSRFMMKLGWRDDRSAAVKERVVEYHLTGRPIETMFDLIEYDEGRDPVATQAWLG